ncbi:MAG: NAD(P)-dependent oxidoreductase [Burkholderiales bacterium]|jgi:3-hydroxyisobutyrate dehydrogenase-like beta-hydroxyacid dehydrogenase
MSQQKPKVGCIGAGVLGSAIMRRLIDCGFAPMVWNRDQAKLADVLKAGASAANSPAELTRACDFVITCISDGNAVEKVVFGKDGVAEAGGADKVLVDMSTCAAAHTKAMAERLAQQSGMAWLDSPISGGAPAALEGKMAIMVGGRAEVFERAQPLWDVLAGRATLMGPNGAGQATKMINQVLVSTGLAVLAEACGFAERAGIDAAKIPQALAGGRADSRQLQEMFPKMVASDFAITGRAALMVKDLELIHDLSRHVGAPLPVTAGVTELFRKMVADGWGERDNTEMVNYYRTRKN